MSPKKITKPLDVYVRVSRVGGRDGDSFISPELQEERCRALAAARGLEVGLVLTDLDVSGGKMARPELDRALNRIREGVSAGIIVARLDRFARTLVGGLSTIEEIQEAGGVMLTAEGDFDTSTAQGELVLNLMLSLAAFELRRLKEGWSASRSKMVARGVHGGSVAPIGYRIVLDERGKRVGLEVEPETAPIIREAFAMRVRGESWKAIYRYMSGAGVTTHYSLSAIPRIIANRAYVGEARSGEYVLEGAHEAIVSEGVWQAANRSKSDRLRVPGNGEGALLSSLLRCAGCGGRLTATYTMHGDKRHSFYACKNKLDCKAKATISASLVEPFVEDAVLALMRERATVSGRELPNVKGLQAELIEATRQLNAWDDSFDADSDPEAFKRGRAKRKARVEEAAARLADARIEEAGTESSLRTLTLWAQAPEGAEAYYRSRPVSERRTMLAAMLASPATVSKGRGPVEERVSLVAA